MSPPHIEELLVFYALDALDEKERELVESYLEKHPDARLRVEEMIEAAAELPYSTMPLEPSPHSKERLLRRVAEYKTSRVKAQGGVAGRRENRPERLIGLLGLVTATIAIVWVVILNSEVSRLRTEISILDDALVAQSSEIRVIHASLPQILPRTVVTVSLTGTEIQPQAHGQLIASLNSQSGVLVAADLAPLKAGRAYQVWLIRDGTAASAGILEVDERGRAVTVITADAVIGSFDMLGISIEPAQGSPQPTGEIVVLSSLQ